MTAVQHALNSNLPVSVHRLTQAPDDFSPLFFPIEVPYTEIEANVDIFINTVFSTLQYERFLGRPFAGHRDSVSELVGEVMENAVEERLRKAGISFRKTKRAERIEGFDQAPDFIIPDEWNPQIVVEAKITEDDGTARDKVTRIQHLTEISNQRQLQGQSGFQVIACIDGRGFGVRREDMRKLLVTTRGRVFTLKTLDYLVTSTDLQRFRSML